MCSLPSPDAHAREDAHSNAGDSGFMVVIFRSESSSAPRREDGFSASPNRAAEILTVTYSSSEKEASTSSADDADSRSERLP